MSQTSAQLQRYRDVGLQEVEGWGIDADLLDIFARMNEFQRSHKLKGSLCEIGVHHGKTLILLALLAAAGERVVGVDLFEDQQAENLDASGMGSLARTRVNLERHAPHLPVELIAANSFDLDSQQLQQLGGARIFHIDGGHFLEVVLNDLRIAQQSLAPGGIIVIDDYWHSLFPEVHEAVLRYFSTTALAKAVPFMTGRNKIFLAHMSHKDRLLEFMKGVFPASRRRPVKLLGHPAICCDHYP